MALAFLEVALGLTDADLLARFPCELVVQSEKASLLDSVW